MINNGASGKFLEIGRKRLILDFVKNCDYDKIIKQQSKLTFNGGHKSYTSCFSRTFKQNEVVMDKPINAGFAILEVSKLHMYETYCDKLQPYFGQEKKQLQYLDTHGLILGMKKQKIIRDLKKRRFIQFQ